MIGGFYFLNRFLFLCELKIRSSSLFVDVSPVINFSSWRKIMPLSNSSEVFGPANDIETVLTSQSLDIKKSERNALCVLVYFWSRVHELSRTLSFHLINPMVHSH